MKNDDQDSTAAEMISRLSDTSSDRLPSGIAHGLYNEEYFERGVITGISGYMNYSWMPELTLRMAHYLALELPLETDHTVLDFGCAKGFLVKALRILDIEAYGVDVSQYAIRCVDGQVREYCRLINGCEDSELFSRDYDWLLAKDVFEHIDDENLRLLLSRARPHVARMFVAVPLAHDDHSGKFIVPSYDADITHVTARSDAWWQRLFEEQDWHVCSYSNTFRGCKENWTSDWPDGNGFFILES